MKKLLQGIVPVLLLVTMATPGFAENREGAVTLSPFVGGYLLDHSQPFENRPILGLRAGYNFTKNLGAEAMFGYSLTEMKEKYNSRETDLYRYGVDVLYHFNPDGNFVPFVEVGGGVTNFHVPNTPSVREPYYIGQVNYGVGFKYFVADNVALRGDVRHAILVSDPADNNLEYSAGLTFQFGGKTKPAPAAVAQPVCPPLVQTLDSDGDGVPDALDKCPGTPAGVAVDKDGCPLDSDHDGVPDYLDKCPNTPAGVAVDKDGCPLDSDHDGVADYLDKCPNTPAGVAVDQDGCPLDSDHDGVPDYLDKCPNTPAGVKVDATGCPEVVYVQKKEAAAKRFCSKPAVLAIKFDTNKADIKPQYHDELKTVGDFLEYFPKAKGEISGHADYIGTKAHNLKLSQARADSVKKYIVETFGIKAARIDTKGYGYSKPVASNKTEAGRAQNRRIEANFTCE